ncbi:MAG: hypothetical protein R3F14_36275 [Polyangiaceae bacterium]
MMAKGRFEQLVSRFGLACAVVGASLSLGACTNVESDADFEDVDEASSAIGPTGSNNIPPAAYDSDPLARPVTNSFNITTLANADPVQLCKAGTVTSTGCILKSQWEDWMNADEENRVPMMKGIAKCAVDAGFITDSTGELEFPGQWNLFPTWRLNRLEGQAKRERMSACLISLVNGENQTLNLCLIGPGASPFSDGCDDPSMTTREGGYFGDLFAATPTAYVAGPDAADGHERARLHDGERELLLRRGRHVVRAPHRAGGGDRGVARAGVREQALQRGSGGRGRKRLLHVVLLDPRAGAQLHQRVHFVHASSAVRATVCRDRRRISVERATASLAVA